MNIFPRESSRPTSSFPLSSLSLSCFCLLPRTMNAIRHVVPDKTRPKQCAWRKMEEAEFERTSEKPVKTVLKARRVPRNVAKRIIERTGPSKNCFHDFFEAFLYLPANKTMLVHIRSNFTLSKIEK